MRLTPTQVSIHALLAECDLPRSQTWQNCARFQSTHSLRSATHDRVIMFDKEAVSIHALLAECDSGCFHVRGQPEGFNPRTPCGVRRGALQAYCAFAWFQSTHSLRSATGETTSKSIAETRFNPRTPCGVRLPVKGGEYIINVVSIHALLAECDKLSGFAGIQPASFNPRTPCGVRPGNSPPTVRKKGFQSTHSLRSATNLSIHLCRRRGCFNPRTPCGVRPGGSPKE